MELKFFLKMEQTDLNWSKKMAEISMQMIPSYIYPLSIHETLNIPCKK